MKSLTTGCGKLDSLLEGGIPIGVITLIYGEASTGKTMLCLGASIEAGRRGSQVIYVDSDSSLTSSRLNWMLKGLTPKELEELGLLFFRPLDFYEQRELIEGLEAYLRGDCKLIVIDSVTNLYRAALAERSTFKLNRELGRQLAYLAELAVRKDLAVLCTAQVHSKPLLGVTELVAKRVLTYWSRAILRLGFPEDRTFRELKVEDFPEERIKGRSILLTFGSGGALCC
ncbi:MAG: ATPase domain-containing protein [Candidatus Bathyarchaeia archaeon]